MPSRIARLAVALVCAAGLLASSLVGTAAAKDARARTSVVGGAPASLTSWGFTAAVLTTHTLCTGSVLSPTKVLTAAHCVSSPSSMTVRTNSTSAFIGGDVHAVSSIAVNPAWARGFTGDLAVLTLQSPTAAPAIRLPTASEDPALTRPGSLVSVAGFGARNPTPTRKPKIGLLMATTVTMRGFCPLPVSLMCDSGGKSGLVAISRVKHKVRRRTVQRTVCAGDSGGPMVAATASGPTLIGVAEATAAPPKRSPFGFVYCGLKGYPGIHTRVASWLGFIQSG
jgi:secreted trypsin-like serine protease